MIVARAKGADPFHERFPHRPRFERGFQFGSSCQPAGWAGGQGEEQNIGHFWVEIMRLAAQRLARLLHFRNPRIEFVQRAGTTFGWNVGGLLDRLACVAQAVERGGARANLDADHVAAVWVT